MRYSKLFGKTVKETSADMRLVSHKLLHQGGFIRESVAGRYFFLPLGINFPRCQFQFEFLCNRFLFKSNLFVFENYVWSSHPIQFKKRLWISNLSIAATRGLFGFVAAWCIFDDNPFNNPTPWAMGFVMAMYNTRIVRRSNALMDYAYGRRFRYAEFIGVGPSLLAPVISVPMICSGDE